MGHRERWAEQVRVGYIASGEAPLKTPTGIVRFEWLKVFGSTFKSKKRQGETFTQYMKRIGLWR